MIVEGFDVIEEHSPGLGTVFRDSFLEAFSFERGEKTFHRRVIVAAGFATHTGCDIVDLQRLAESLGRVLNVAIGITRRNRFLADELNLQN